MLCAITLAPAAGAEPVVVPIVEGGTPAYGAARLVYDPGTLAGPVPMRVVRGTHALVRATVAGRGYDLLIDTGASRTWLPPDVPGRPAGDRRVVERLCFENGVCFEDAVVEARQTPFTVDRPGYYNGLLGMDLLRHFDVTLDYLRGRFHFRDVRNADAPGAAEVPFTLDDRTLRPMGAVAAAGARPERVLLDTGAMVTRITPATYRRLEPPPPVRATGLAVGAKRRDLVDHVAIDGYCLGGACADGVVAQVAGWPAVGGSFFARFLTTFRFPERVVGLVPYRRPRHLRVPVLERYGLQVSLTDAADVVWVASGGAADRAGLDDGDVLVSVEGVVAAEAGYLGLMDHLYRSRRTEHTFVVRRAGATVTLTVRTADGTAAESTAPSPGR